MQTQETTSCCDDFAVLYQDDYLVAIHKPSGVLVHRSMMDRHAQQFALQMTRDAVGRKVFPVHRLDKPTSGLMIFAFSSEIANSLQMRFQSGSVEKYYTALVRGWPKEKRWHIERALKYQVDRYSEKDVYENKIQAAETGFECLATTFIEQAVGRFDTARYALIKARPFSGRKHQIRRHLNFCNHPVIGDTNHGDRHHNRFFRERFGVQRLYLAATELRFLHPVGGQQLILTAPLQKNFEMVKASLDWRIR